MRNLFIGLLTLISIYSCSSDKLDTSITTNEYSNTKVYIQGMDFSGKFIQTVSNTEECHFFIRIDGRIPEIEGDNFPSEQYLPQNPKGWRDMTLISDQNAGVLNIDYPFSTEGAIAPITRYVYDSTGKNVKKVIVSEPSIQQLLAANRNTEFNAYINKINLDNCKVIWYVAKEGQSNGWHVDGILTMKSTNDVTEIPGITIGEDKDYNNSADKVDSLLKGNVEVDIHQQEHKDWNEIKTSIHIRDYVETTTVEIPLGKEYWTEADDFAIREYKLYINGSELPSPVKVTVEHKDDKLIITATITDENYLKELLDKYNDGVTIEVHSYPVGISQDKVWEAIKNAKVTTSKETTLKVNKSSAYK